MLHLCYSCKDMYLFCKNDTSELFLTQGVWYLKMYDKTGPSLIQYHYLLIVTNNISETLYILLYIALVCECSKVLPNGFLYLILCHVLNPISIACINQIISIIYCFSTLVWFVIKLNYQAHNKLCNSNS